MDGTHQAAVAMGKDMSFNISEMIHVIRPANCVLAVFWGLQNWVNDAILFIRKVERSHDAASTCWRFHDYSPGS